MERAPIFRKGARINSAMTRIWLRAYIDFGADHFEKRALSTKEVQDWEEWLLKLFFTIMVGERLRLGPSAHR